MKDDYTIIGIAKYTDIYVVTNGKEYLICEANSLENSDGTLDDINVEIGTKCLEPSCALLSFSLKEFIDFSQTIGDALKLR